MNNRPSETTSVGAGDLDRSIRRMRNQLVGSATFTQLMFGREDVRAVLDALDAFRTLKPVGWVAACGLSQLRGGRVTTVWPEHDHLAEPVGLCIAPSAPQREPEA